MTMGNEMGIFTHLWVHAEGSEITVLEKRPRPQVGGSVTHTSKRWQQPQCPQTTDWAKKTCDSYFYTYVNIYCVCVHIDTRTHDTRDVCMHRTCVHVCMYHEATRVCIIRPGRRGPSGPL